MTREQHLLGESIQEITLYAWPIIWNDNKYDQDSRVVLETIREWAEEFEKWWLSHSENWMDRHDYREEAEAFAKIKCDQYLESIGALEQKQKYIVLCTRIEEYTSTFLVEAEDTDAAKKAVKEAIAEDDPGYYVGKMTEVANSTQQRYEVMSVWDGKTECDFDLTQPK